MWARWSTQTCVLLHSWEILLFQNSDVYRCLPEERANMCVHACTRVSCSMCRGKLLATGLLQQLFSDMCSLKELFILMVNLQVNLFLFLEESRYTYICTYSIYIYNLNILIRIYWDPDMWEKVKKKKKISRREGDNEGQAKINGWLDRKMSEVRRQRCVTYCRQND